MLCFGAVFDRFGPVFGAETIENGAETIENDAETIENGAETKHLNSTRTARPPKGPGSSSRIQMLKSNKLRKFGMKLADFFVKKITVTVVSKRKSKSVKKNSENCK